MVKTKDGLDLYTLALNHMLHGEYKTAIKCLKDVVKHDTDNIDAYIKLGVLLRETGEGQNAVKVHQGLLFRREMPQDERIIIMRHLLEDYEALEDREKALEIAQKIVDMTRRNLWAYDKMHKLYRDLGNWEKAAEYLQKTLRFYKKTQSRLLAIYKVQEGMEKYKIGQYHEARLIFRKAIKIDPRCEAPYYHIANSYMKDQRQEDAILWWEKYADVAPEKASLIFQRIQRVLFNLGNFSKIEDFYQKILAKRPDDIQANLALASFYDRKGDLNKAIATCDDLKDKKPNSIAAKLMLVKFLVQNKELHRASEVLNGTIEYLQGLQTFVCSNCGNQIAEIRWLCPACGEPDTYLSEL